MLSVLATPYPSWPVDNYSSSNQLSIVKRLEHDLLLFFFIISVCLYRVSMVDSTSRKQTCMTSLRAILIAFQSVLCQLKIFLKIKQA